MKRLHATHLPELDGWRAISILLVLACHMLPLGPKRWELNIAAGNLGMMLFFALSGFLITVSLWTLHDTRVFFIRRLTRILPAYLLVVALALLIARATVDQWLAYVLFYTNYHFNLLPGTGPLWSLCVEVHFYLGIGLLMWATRFRGFWLLPVGFAVMTVSRAYFHWGTTIETHVRINELLAGATLAVAYLQHPAHQKPALSFIPWWLWLATLLATSLPAAGALQYARPLIAVYGIGQTLVLNEQPIFKPLRSASLRYVATISYALYLFHSLTLLGWLGSGDTLHRYLKRPLCIAISFAAAHLSTFTLESWCNQWGRRWASWIATTNESSPTSSRRLVGIAPA